MDDLDLRLREGLERLAAAVPVSPARTDTAPLRRPVFGTGGAGLSLVSVVVALLAIVLIVAGLGVAGHGPTPRPAASLPSASAGATPTASASSPASAPAALGGYNWTAIDTGQFGGVALSTVTRGANGQLLGIGDWLTATAPDGTPRHPTTWTSSDGITWTQLPNGSAFTSQHPGWDEVVVDVVPNGPGFVAVGMEQQGDSSSADAAAWYSSDGRAWNRATVRDGIGRTMDQVLATAKGFVAIGEAGYSFHAGFGLGTAVWTSPDGRTWTRVPDREAPTRGTRLRSVVDWNGSFFAAATFEYAEGASLPPPAPLTAGVWSSPDAVHWAPIQGTPLELVDLVPCAGGLVALGTGQSTASGSTPLAWRSADGRAWSQISLPVPSGLPTGTSIYAVQLGSEGGGLLAFGGRDDTFSTIGWSSPDGSAWMPVDLATTIADATIDRVVGLEGSLLVLGHRSTASGSEEPALWLLTP